MSAGARALHRAMMTLIHHHGRPAAIATSRRVQLLAPFDEQPPEHPALRRIIAKAAYARDIAAGELPGPYTDEAAQEYATAFLAAGDRD